MTRLAFICAAMAIWASPAFAHHEGAMVLWAIPFAAIFAPVIAGAIIDALRKTTREGR